MLFGEARQSLERGALHRPEPPAKEPPEHPSGQSRWRLGHDPRPNQGPSFVRPNLIPDPHAHTDEHVLRKTVGLDLFDRSSTGDPEAEKVGVTSNNVTRLDTLGANRRNDLCLPSRPLGRVEEMAHDEGGIATSDVLGGDLETLTL